VYPACGGGSACGGISYSQSVAQGTAAVVSAVSAFAKSCPSSEIVLVGYSQVSDVVGEVEGKGAEERELTHMNRDLRSSILSSVSCYPMRLFGDHS